ncbi:MAG: hypothetical protein MMC33_004871 [Icmadophila ericetorum]|nr:hypothetical protein [Icmadophila ericetorum]
MSMPTKYREIGDFHEYYSGKRKAPYLTVFVGGNHEASNHLFELYHGGWVAPNIFYLGAANIVRYGPLRIAGLSGIWKGYNYKEPHFERLPYNHDDVKSIYHVREIDVRKLLQVRTQVDVGISHDWPRGIERKGDYKTLFRKKDLFEADSLSGKLGSAAAQYVLDRLRPPHWFSAHLHIKFSAINVFKDKAPVVPKEIPADQRLESLAFDRLTPEGILTASGQLIPCVPTKPRNSDEIDISLDEEDTQDAAPVAEAIRPSVHNSDEVNIDIEDEDLPAHRRNSGTRGVTYAFTDGPDATMLAIPNEILDTMVPEDVRAQLPASFAPSAKAKEEPKLPFPEGITNTITHFLALDKCLPERQFLQILEIEPVAYSESSPDAPYTLSYDKEWLAITRAFAPELRLGDRSTSIPDHKGELFYRTRIEQEEVWIEENVVTKGLMKIPETFELTAPIYDASVAIDTKEQLREYTNPQTTAFCQLVGIDNPFHISEEERDRRMAEGPPASERDLLFPGFGGGGGRGGGRRGGYRGRSGRSGRGRWGNSNIDIWSGRRKGF